MDMYIAGKWTKSDQTTTICSPYSGDQVDTVPLADLAQVEVCLAAAVAGAKAMAELTAYERCEILNKAANLLSQQVEDFARTISLEQGKPITESRGEAGRIADLLRLCAFEGAQLRGETLPIEAQSATKGKMGMTLRVPCGVVVAITPHNYPLLLVLHKIGPALAVGNSVILKPAGQTPLIALKLTKTLLDAGLPENGLQCITGSGSKLGPVLCSDPRVRKISFTGSVEVGEQITQVAGIKKLSLELGSNCPVIVLDDANLEQVADAVAIGGYVNAGQVCISTQRVIVQQKVYGDFLDALKLRVEAIKVGDSLAEDTKVSAMISEQEAQRVGSFIDEAVAAGAQLVTGGQRDKAVFAPTIVADVKPQMRIACEELFGPAIAAMPVKTVEEAIACANDSKFGLGAGIFTSDMNTALRFARQAECGNVMINWSSLWRADLMPYGGFKLSGIGKEGPRYAIEEMTELKTVVFHGLDD
jgi:acyl-CoA reductase-like NAD-dependent aldehyde dehydrogenase